MNRITTLAEFDASTQDGQLTQNHDFVFTIPLSRIVPQLDRAHLAHVVGDHIKLFYSGGTRNHLSLSHRSELGSFCCGGNRLAVSIALGVSIAPQASEVDNTTQTYYGYCYLAQFLNSCIWIDKLHGDWPVAQLYAPAVQTSALQARFLAFVVRSMFEFFEFGTGPVQQARQALRLALENGWTLSPSRYPLTPVEVEVRKRCAKGRRIFSVIDEMEADGELEGTATSAALLKHLLVLANDPIWPAIQ